MAPCVRVVRFIAAVFPLLLLLLFVHPNHRALAEPLSVPPVGPPPDTLSGTHAGEDDGDPDLPAFLNGRIDKRDYLLSREAHIARLRGVPNNLPYNARARAIGVLEDQLRMQHARDVFKGTSTTATSWTELGPAPIPNGQTSPTNPVSGRVTAIAIHPTNPNIVYVGTAQGGFYRTTNGGGSWTQLFDTAQTLAIGSIAISPVHPSIVFVGTGEPNLSLDSYFGVGLYIIRNADTSPIINGPYEVRSNGGTGHAFLNSSIASIVVHPSNDSVIFVGSTLGVGGMSGSINLVTSLGLYYSNNVLSASPSFAYVSSLPGGGVAGVTDIVMKPGAPDTLVVGSQDLGGGGTSGIYRSTNATLGTSSSWTKEMSFSGPTNVRFAVNKVGSTVTMIAGVETSNGQLIRSTDAGATWSSALSAANGFCGGQCFYDIAIAMDPGNANIIYLGGSADASPAAVMKKSTDGGSTFTVSDAGLHADNHAVAVAPSNSSIVYTGDDGGVFKSTNAGGAWTSLNTTGFNATQFESIALHPHDTHFSIGGTQDNGTNWLHPTNSWTRADFGDGGFALIDQNATDTVNVTMYHTYFNQTNNLIGFARVTSTTNATDNGWSFLGYSFPTSNNGISGSDGVLFYAPMALGPGNPNTLYFGTTRLYRSTNTGTSMSTVSQSPLNSTNRVSAIGISPQSDSVRIVGLENGKVYSTSTASSTLTDVTGTIPAFYVARAVIDPNNRKTAYVTLSGFGLAAGQHVWKTTNLNLATPTWSAAGNGIPDVPVNAFTIDPTNSAHLFAGTDIGVYASTDGGSTWNPLGTGLPRVAVFDMAIQPISRVLRIATHGRGMWEIAIDAALPIQLAGFWGEPTPQRSVRLEWTTISEVNNYGFEVQRRPDSTNTFVTLGDGFVPGHGTTVEQHTYGFTDQSPAPGQYWYRLRQLDLDGGVSYSEPVQISVPSAAVAEGLPGVSSLDQNFPNPFNPTTSIAYTVGGVGIQGSGVSTVRLRVYDLLGREVATLVNEREQPGTYSVAFDGSHLASGVYFYRLDVGTFVFVRKLVLLK